MVKRWLLTGIIAVLVVTLILGGCSSTSQEAKQAPDKQEVKQEAAEQKYPVRAIEFVSGYSPGGGTDTMLRTAQKILMEERIITVPINVVNVVGGSGAVGQNYVGQKVGDPYYVMALGSGFWTNPLLGTCDYGTDKFTPIARLGMDSIILMVKGDSPYNTLDDLVNAAKKKGYITAGGTGFGSGDHIFMNKLAEQSGVKFDYVPFQSGGEVTTALLGGHIDFTMGNPNEAYAQIKEGMFRVLAVSTAERLLYMPDVPTFKELGFDMEYQLPRAVVAPADIPENARKYLEDAFRKLAESEHWKTDYLEKFMVAPGYQDGAGLAKTIEEYNNYFKDGLTKLDLIKEK